MTPNTLAHFAINADDIDASRAFYSKVFGWKFQSWGPPGFYQIEAKGSPVMGALQGRRTFADGTRAGFEPTFAVASIDATEKAVAAAGGRVLLERSVIVGVGTLMFFADPSGNVFGAMQYDAKAE
ncbi:MAG: VOC family protein [Deltaproteobacteria bacterium]|nr:VOC family protein [Deltaproteobacteria bacterium]